MVKLEHARDTKLRFEKESTSLKVNKFISEDLLGEINKLIIKGGYGETKINLNVAPLLSSKMNLESGAKNSGFVKAVMDKRALLDILRPKFEDSGRELKWIYVDEFPQATQSVINLVLSFSYLTSEVTSKSEPRESTKKPEVSDTSVNTVIESIFKDIYDSLAHSGSTESKSKPTLGFLEALEKFKTL